jgi:hypothetical protein
MSAIPALEYYLSSVVGWLLFGFLSNIGDFHLLGVHIKFSGYFFLVFVVIFYLCLFYLGRKMLQLLQQEYNVGRMSLLSKEEIRKRFVKTKLVNSAKRNGKLKLSELNKVNPTSVVPEKVSERVIDRDEREGEEKVEADPPRIVLQVPSSVCERAALSSHDDSDAQDNDSVVDEVLVDKTIHEIKTSLLNSKPMKYLRSRGIILKDEDDLFSYYEAAKSMMETEVRENILLHDLMCLNRDSDSDASFKDIDESESDDRVMKRRKSFDRSDRRSVEVAVKQTRRSTIFADENNSDISDDSFDYNNEESAGIRVCRLPINAEKMSKTGNSEQGVSLRYLKLKGITFTGHIETSKCLTVEKALRKVEAQAQELADLKELLCKDSDDSDDSDDIDDRMERLGGGSGSSSDDDFDEEAAIEAYRYLEEWGLDLLDDADVKECVELARILMREERDPIEGHVT